MLSAPPINRPRLSLDDSAAQRRRRTLLVVDDEEGPRQSLRFLFKDDYEVLLADSGDCALEIARQKQVDAAVLDIRMAGMSGIDLLNHLKELDPAIEIIMLTAYETIDTARQALRLGACDYLTKPFDLPAMRASVANAMERHAVSQQVQLNGLRLIELQEEIQDRKLREEIIRAKGEIYASIIHDINGPLTIISGFADLINQRLDGAHFIHGEDLDLVRDRVLRITRQVNNCVEISRRYLSFLRQRSGDGQPVELKQILADMQELLRAHPAARNHELVVRPVRDNLWVTINGTDFIQILLNLCINALQASPVPHRVEVEATRLNEPLDLAGIPSDSENRIINRLEFKNTAPLLAISVRDNGPGIAPEILQRVFEPYFTTKNDAQGTGLGLSIVHRLVKEAHGLIHLQTAQGRGTNFTVYLPAQEPRPAN